MKFGGSCLVNSTAFNQIEEIIEIYKSHKLVFVLSAFNGITNRLISVSDHAQNHDLTSALEELIRIEEVHFKHITELFSDNQERFNQVKNKVIEFIDQIRNLLSEIDEFGTLPYFLDFIQSFGEKISTYVLTEYLQMKGRIAEYFIGEDLIITNDEFNNALPEMIHSKRRVIQKLMHHIDDPNDNCIPCVTGFVGRNKTGLTTTLGRGGSDFTATILARLFHEILEERGIQGEKVKVIFWKDVDGILNTNPKYVNNPHLIKYLNYGEAKEMAFYGAKILHPKCLASIEKQEIIAEIRNFDKPKSKVYSIISKDSNTDEIKGISTIENMAQISIISSALVNVPGVLGKIFSLMGNNYINISMVAQSSSEVNTTFVIEQKDLRFAMKLLNSDPFFDSMWFEIKAENVSIIAITGDNVNESKVKLSIFSALHRGNIEILCVAQSSYGINISFLVKTEDVKHAVKVLHEEFFGK